MRHLFVLLVSVSVTFSTAADPKPDANKAGNDYGVALQKTAGVLATVKDEATATDAKPKLEKLHEEAREARRQLFRTLAEVDMREGELAESMSVFWKNARQIHDLINTEFDRIGSHQKAAYKVLRDTKLFAALEKEYEGRATLGAMMLDAAAKTYSTRNLDKTPMLQDLMVYLTAGKKALIDPWGFPYQMVTKVGKDGALRTHVWTVSPYSGKKLGTPPPDEK